MNISEASKLSELTPKMIRNYEDLAIISKAKRTPAGYRQYSETDVHILKFVKKSRELGFSLKDIKELVSLWKNKKRSSSQVKSIALKHIAELEIKYKEIEGMLKTLNHLAKNCHGDQRPDCPILDELDSQS